MTASPQLTTASQRLLALLRDGRADASDFAPAFLDQVSLDRLTTLAAELRANNGPVTAIEATEPQGATGALLKVGYERAVVTVRFALDPAPPHRVIGLLVTDVARRDDSAAKIVADLRVLPGHASLLVTQLGIDKPVPIISVDADRPLATGSQFKLFVLAELAAQIAAGERRWSDVVALGPPSLPSGVMQSWPTGAPVTLSTLAVQMISISDNTAADTLLGVLGRERVDAMRASVGSTPGSLPVLATREAFGLKTKEYADQRRFFEHASLADRRAVLSVHPWRLSSIDTTQLAGAPLHIDTVEWPATATEIARVLDRLRMADQHGLDILSITPGLAPDTQGRFVYAGYKGGSEAGVIALAWLLRTEDGRWFAVSGIWNNTAAPVDGARFAALMARAVALIG